MRLWFMLCCSAFMTTVWADCQIIDPELAQGQYQGGCKDGWAHGYGEVTGISSYQGDFYLGKKHGKGIKVMSNGDRYVGEFVDDRRHGKGTYIWGEKTEWAGDRYQGDYIADLRHGYGVFKWYNGDRYEGAWENDFRLGPSVLEKRHYLATQGALKALTVGQKVCAQAQLGSVAQIPLHAIIMAIHEGRLQLQLIAASGDKVAYAGQVLQNGSAFEDEPLNWRICAA